MGGSSTKYNQNGGMFIQLENTVYFGGQEVSGMIHIDIHSQMSPSTLYLIFKGKETTHWEESRRVSERDLITGNTVNRTVTDYYDGKAKFCNFQYPIYRWDYPLPCGGYSLPFRFILPTSVPGSFYYACGHTKAEITYKFHAKLVSVANEKLKARLPMFVRQASFDYKANITANKNARMKTWCCCDQGTCSINVVFPQDTYNPTQVATMTANVDNSQSKLDVNGITASLNSSVRLKSSSGHTHFFKETIVSQHIPMKIRTGESLLNSSSVELQLNLPSRMDMLGNMHSTTGSLIDCVYSVDVRANMDGSCMCCGDEPAVQNIMKIIPNAVIAPSAPVAPPNWNPQVLEAVALQYDSKYEVKVNTA